MIAALREKKPLKARRLFQPQVQGTASVKSNEDSGLTTATINGSLVTAVLLDTGADTLLVSKAVIEALELQGAFVNIAIEKYARMLLPVGESHLMVTRRVRFDDIILGTSAGDLILHDLVCWILEDDRPFSLTIGRPVLNRLGFSTDHLLATARETSEHWDVFESMDGPASGIDSQESRLNRAHKLTSEALHEGQDHEIDEPDRLVMTPTPKADAEAVRKALDEQLMAARQNGLPPVETDHLAVILETYEDCFRVSFGRDPPVSVSPPKVRLKADARTIKAKARRYPPEHRAFIEDHMNDLMEHGLVFENHRSRWSSAPRIVNKKDPGDYGTTVDTRAVNALTEPMPWPMPDLEADLGKIDGSTCYFNYIVFECTGNFLWTPSPRSCLLL